jgi:DNA-binding response OmpR family regulator
LIKVLSKLDKKEPFYQSYISLKCNVRAYRVVWLHSEVSFEDNLSIDLNRHNSVGCSCVLCKLLGVGKPRILTFKVGFSHPRCTSGPRRYFDIACTCSYHLKREVAGQDNAMKRFRILVVDDEERILNFLRSKLQALGYEVLTASNGVEALEQVQAQEPDLMVLDLIIPKMNGFDALKELRRFSTMPVIVLSARGADTDKIKGLSLGADDYLAKPFNPDELVARIEAVRRRLEPAERRKTAEPLSLQHVTIDFKKRCAAVSGEEKHLTRIEWLLLSELARNTGRLMFYEDLLTQVWGLEYRNDIQLLRTWISRLRYKIERDPANPAIIRTIPKAGYIIDQPVT